MLKAADHCGGHEHQWLAKFKRLQKGDDGELAAIEFAFAHHGFETLIGGFRTGIIQRDEIAANLACFEGTHEI